MKYFSIISKEISNIQNKALNHLAQSFIIIINMYFKGTTLQS
jgi:hypothetical protein